MWYIFLKKDLCSEECMTNGARISWDSYQPSRLEEKRLLSSERKSKYFGNQIKEVSDAINVVHPIKERSVQ
jgi:hypothetical protein